MKKLLLSLCALFLAVSLTGCGGGDSASRDDKTLTVSATLDPHSKILEEAKPILKERYDIDLNIKVLDDYYIFNKALDEGEVDANYFQHRPFFEGEVAEHGYKIVEAAGIHLEPFGFYSKTIKDIQDIPNNAEVIISNSVADHGRILGILEDAGIIEINDNVERLEATTKDITSNPKNLTFTEVKPELLATTFNNGEGDLVAINGNYALQGGLNPTEDALIIEQVNEDNPYINIVAVQEGHENDEKIKALIEVLKSDEIKEFVDKEYKGAVVMVD